MDTVSVMLSAAVLKFAGLFQTPAIRLDVVAAELIKLAMLQAPVSAIL